MKNKYGIEREKHFPHNLLSVIKNIIPLEPDLLFISI
jgi:hypothetical protein